MHNLIETATEEVEREGYLHADSKSVQLAAFGYLARITQIEQQTTRDHIDTRFNESRKSPQKKMADGAKTTGLVGGLVALFEAMKALFS